MSSVCVVVMFRSNISYSTVMPKRLWITKDAGKSLPSLLWTIKPERTLMGFLPQSHLLHLDLIGPILSHTHLTYRRDCGHPQYGIKVSYQVMNRAYYKNTAINPMGIAAAVRMEAAIATAQWVRYCFLLAGSSWNSNVRGSIINSKWTNGCNSSCCKRTMKIV